MTIRSGTSVFALFALSSCLVESGDEHLAQVSSAQLRGAIFTTLADGSRVNENLFASKADVYLDGGPAGGSPPGAAALPAGDYFFQVTDPSGKVLLSTDHISCRRITVSDAGVIVAAHPGTNYTLTGGVWTASPCQHATGVDRDHASLGAITVQLMPYLDTPNPGGVYKVWVTPIGRYAGDANFVPGPDDESQHAARYRPGSFHGFVPAHSKTDNFKVRVPVSPPNEEPPGEEPPGEEPPGEEPPKEPCCGDGHLDPGEECDDGNTIDGDGCSATCEIEVPPPPPEKPDLVCEGVHDEMHPDGH